MAGNENWMDAFRAKNGGNVYVLQVSIMEEGKEVKYIKEVVDCPKGEAGVWYAGNLLCRLANEAVKGTKLETHPWREFHTWKECHKFAGGSSKNYLYKKVKDPVNYAKAEMERQC